MKRKGTTKSGNKSSNKKLGYGNRDREAQLAAQKRYYQNLSREKKDERLKRNRERLKRKKIEAEEMEWRREIVGEVILEIVTEVTEVTEVRDLLEVTNLPEALRKTPFYPIATQFLLPKRKYQLGLVSSVRAANKL